MAMHFARGIINPSYPISTRLSAECHAQARQMPPFRRNRFLATRALLAELMFMLYGTARLPTIIPKSDGRLCFADDIPVSFSLACAGNVVGVALATSGECGLDMALRRSASIPGPTSLGNENDGFTRSELIWINNQNDPIEARIQLTTLRKSMGKLLGPSGMAVELQPGAGRMRLESGQRIEALCDAEDILIWSLAASPEVGSLQFWELDNRYGWQAIAEEQRTNGESINRMMRFICHPKEKALTFKPFHTSAT
jgi:phosphopantetheinyl transferase